MIYDYKKSGIFSVYWDYILLVRNGPKLYVISAIKLAKSISTLNLKIGLSVDSKNVFLMCHSPIRFVNIRTLLF